MRREYITKQLEAYSKSPFNTHYGRLISREMLKTDYSYAELARLSGLNDSANIRVVVSGSRREPEFKTIAKIAGALDIDIREFVIDWNK